MEDIYDPSKHEGLLCIEAATDTNLIIADNSQADVQNFHEVIQTRLRKQTQLAIDLLAIRITGGIPGLVKTDVISQETAARLKGGYERGLKLLDNLPKTS